MSCAAVAAVAPGRGRWTARDGKLDWGAATLALFADTEKETDLLTWRKGPALIPADDFTTITWVPMTGAGSTTTTWPTR